MRPHVTCLMAVSIDGRTRPSRWRPARKDEGEVYGRAHDELGCDAWLIGRSTGSEYAKGTSYPKTTERTFPRESWFARKDAKAYGVVLDAKGKIAWGRSDIGGDPLVTVLTESVSDAHLAGLRDEGISYVFGGKSELDLALVLDTLHVEIGVKRLLLEGGGITNGSFLRAGLVDEVSLLVFPVIDGAPGAVAAFDAPPSDEDARAPLTSMKLVETRTLDGGIAWLRYRLESDSHPR